MTPGEGGLENGPSSGDFGELSSTLAADAGDTRRPRTAASCRYFRTVTIPSRPRQAFRLSWPAASTLLLLAAMLCPGPAAVAADSPARLDGRRVLQVQAAYLVNFLRYSEWPGGPPAGAPLLVAVIGDEHVVETVTAVAAVAGPIQDHGVRVLAVDPRALGPGADAQRAEAAAVQLRNSHLVFLDAGSGVQVRDVIELVEGTAVLTVSNMEGFIAEGGMIELYAFGRNIVFGANPQAIQDSGVLLSARVLKLARPLAEGVD